MVILCCLPSSIPSSTYYVSYHADGVIIYIDGVVYYTDVVVNGTVAVVTMQVGAGQNIHGDVTVPCCSQSVVRFPNNV